MIILIDTSVWIEFFKQNPVYATELEALLKTRMVVTIEPIFSELIYGARNDKEKKRILSYWNLLPKIPFTGGSLLSGADFANQHNYHNSGIGLIDAVIIKAALENSCRIWTLDARIEKGVGGEYLFKKDDYWQ
jgi:predicted nucleic acid-binding protein